MIQKSVVELIVANFWVRQLYVINALTCNYKEAPSCCHAPPVKLLSFKSEKQYVSVHSIFLDSYYIFLQFWCYWKPLKKPFVPISSRLTIFFPYIVSPSWRLSIQDIMKIIHLNDTVWVLGKKIISRQLVVQRCYFVNF